MPTFHDPLVPPGTPGLPPHFFDRFVFNLHPPEAPPEAQPGTQPEAPPEGPAQLPPPSLLFGLGVHPARYVSEGFAILVTGTEQRNLRFSAAPDGKSAGPFSWQVLEPMRTWRTTLAPNPSGLEFDLTWHARTPAWTGEVRVDNDKGTPTSFAHLFQSGRWTGTLTVDGHRTDADGWYGQRDRSRGVRTMTGGQGLHLWCQAQFPDRSVGFLLVETRRHERLLLEGAVMYEDGRLDPVVDVRHDLSFDAGLDLRSGTVEVTTAAGAVHLMDCDATAGGGYMAGGGYGTDPADRAGLEHDVYPLDGSLSPRTLKTSLTDRLTTFTCADVRGNGILEFALTRSPAYRYRPTRRRAQP